MAATFQNGKVGRFLLWGALTAAVVIAALWYFGSRYEWAEYKTRTSMTGEARRNPLLAAQLLFERLGIPTHKIEDMPHLLDLPANATLILWTGQALDSDQAERLVQWVKAGGHVVLHTDGNTLNKRLGVKQIGSYFPKPKDDRLTRIAIDDRVLTTEIRYASLLESDQPLLRSATVQGGNVVWFHQKKSSATETASDDADDEPDDDAVQMVPNDSARPARVMVHFALGRGHVTALGNLETFTNQSIGNYDHAEYLVRVARLAGDTAPVYFAPHPHYPSLIAWIAEHAWPALLAALALLVAWLWRAMPRFGPREIAPPTGRPGLLQHLRAVAEFHLKERTFAALLAPLQEDCLRALQLHALREGTAPEPGALAQRLTGLPAADIDAALHAVPIHRHEFLHHAFTLSRIRDALTPSPRHFVHGSNR